MQDVIKLQSHKVSINVYSYIFTMHIDIFHIYSQKRTIFHFWINISNQFNQYGKLLPGITI